MAIQRIDAGDRMSQAVVHGDTVYLSGQVARETAGQAVAEQTREILRLIDALLERAGSSRANVLDVQLYLRDLADLGAVNAVWLGWVSPGLAPTRTTIQTTLASPDYALEIRVVAALL
jgi:enamine deaminase RidA (YjgF/YER057c/UK114 family)